LKKRELARLIKISIIIPTYNEADSIERLIQRVVNSVQTIYEYEILVVDDGSLDNTAGKVAHCQILNPRIKLISLARNTGHMAALTAGLDHCDGDWIITIDADGQDPPELIPQMVTKATEENVDICFMVRADRKNDPFRHRFFSPIFYKLLNRASGNIVPLQAADFRLMSKRVINVLRQLPERDRLYRVITPDLKFGSTTMEYLRQERVAGESKYKFTSLAKLGVRSLLATTGAPLRWLSVASFFVALISILVSSIAFIRGIIGADIPGWASVAFMISIMMTFQAIAIGIISEFLLTAIADVRQRPIYQLKSKK
jgi:polyisoprenyl-phosphate glycosyltransferase